MQEFIFSCGGKELAKVLYYYGFIQNTVSMQFKIVCPIHQDINPSMVIDLETGRYFCFGCNENGDAFTLVRKINKDKNDLQAALLYFKILKSKEVQKIDVSSRCKIEKKSTKQSYTEAHDYYYGLSKINWNTDKSEEVIEVRKYMYKRGFSSSTLNMCKAKITYNYNYPIIFPMLDNNQFAGWVCRTNRLEVEQKRKYLYNEGFTRRNTLVGKYGRKKYVIVVEGYMDRLKMVQNLYDLGIKEDIVAILGWKMSNEQIQKLVDAGITHIISALDNDECGKKGTEFLKTKFKVTRFTFDPGIKDPGEMNVIQFKKMYRNTIKRLAHDRQKQ